MSFLEKVKWMSGTRRRSAIHSGPGTEYTGPLSIISLARGSPRCWGPPDVSPDWTRGQAIPYPPACGEPQLREAVARYLHVRLELTVDADEILITNGATQGIDVASSCLYHRRGRQSSPFSVIFPTPTWWTLPFNQIVSLGGRCYQIPATFNPLTKRWSFDLNLFEAYLREEPDAVFLVLPANPTGQLPAWVGDMLFLLDRYDVPCLLDLTYESMRHDGHPLRLPPLLQGRHNVLIIGSLSKRFAVPGLRVAYLIPPPDLSEACENEIELGTMGVSVLGQAYAACLLKRDLETGGGWFQAALMSIARRCDYVSERLTEAGFSVSRPEAGYYVFARLPDDLPLSGQEFRQALYTGFAVDCIPGDEFGDGFGRFVRFSVGNPHTFEEVEEACDRIENFVSNHQVTLSLSLTSAYDHVPQPTAPD